MPKRTRGALKESSASTTQAPDWQKWRNSLSDLTTEAPATKKCISTPTSKITTHHEEVLQSKKHVHGQASKLKEMTAVAKNNSDNEFILLDNYNKQEGVQDQDQGIVHSSPLRICILNLFYFFLTKLNLKLKWRSLRNAWAISSSTGVWFTRALWSICLWANHGSQSHPWQRRLYNHPLHGPGWNLVMDHQRGSWKWAVWQWQAEILQFAQFWDFGCTFCHSKWF